MEGVLFSGHHFFDFKGEAETSVQEATILLVSYVVIHLCHVGEVLSLVVGDKNWGLFVHERRQFEPVINYHILDIIAIVNDSNVGWRCLWDLPASVQDALVGHEVEWAHPIASDLEGVIAVTQGSVTKPGGFLENVLSRIQLTISVTTHEEVHVETNSSSWVDWRAWGVPISLEEGSQVFIRVFTIEVPGLCLDYTSCLTVAEGWVDRMFVLLEAG